MFSDFDVNEKSNVISILQFLEDGTQKNTSYDLKTKNLIREISNEFLPLGPGLSPAKKCLAFFSGSNPLYLRDIETILLNRFLSTLI